MTADATWVREQRVRAQGLALPTPRTPTEAVRRLAAVQSQEPGHAFWSLALRSTATTEAEVRAAYDAGEFLRTHVLRPTWHFVVAEDVRWLLATTADRVHQANGSMARRRGLGPAEVAAVLADAGLPAAQLDVVLLVMHAELEQVVVSGPMRGATHTYALLDDRVPTTARLRPLVVAHAHRRAHGPRRAARRPDHRRGGGGDLPPPARRRRGHAAAGAAPAAVRRAPARLPRPGLPAGARAPGVPDHLRERAWAQAARLADFLGRDLGHR